MSFAAKVLSHRSYRRRHIVGMGIVAFLLAWGVLWGATAYRLNRMIDQWAQSAAPNGMDFRFAARSTDGSPWTVHAHLDGFVFRHPVGYALEADEAILYLPLWNWRDISAKLKGGIKGEVHTLPFTGDAFPAVPAATSDDTGLNLWVRAFGLTPMTQTPPALGQRLEELSIDLRVMGPPPSLSDVESIRVWNEASGVIEVDALSLVWGLLAVEAKGTVALTNELQPEGAFSGRVKGLEETIDLLRDDQALTARQETMLKASLNVLSRPSGVTGQGQPIVPISLQNGGLFLGPVRLMDIPALTWGAEQEPN